MTVLDMGAAGGGYSTELMARPRVGTEPVRSTARTTRPAARGQGALRNADEGHDAMKKRRGAGRAPVRRSAARPRWSNLDSSSRFFFLLPRQPPTWRSIRAAMNKKLFAAPQAGAAS